MNPRTSLSHPLLIATLPIGNGAIGVTFCPGKRSDSLLGARWDRDLEIDLNAIERWGASSIVTLVESHEMQSLGVPNLGARVMARGIAWYHLPIVDVTPPDEAFGKAWPAVAAQLCSSIRNGQRVLVHCKGGLGRAGTVAACLLIELGIDPQEAIARVRGARPGAIETQDQESYVLNHLGSKP